MVKHGALHKIAVPSRIEDLMSRLAEDMSIPFFTICGGVPLDVYLQPDALIRDVDISIPYLNWFEHVRKSLITRGYKIIESNRPYFINKTLEVSILMARKNEISLDINFLNYLDAIGQFDLESLQSSYPEMTYIDLHDALKAYQNRTAHLLRHIDNENPYLLLSRLVKLAAKYSLPLASNPHLKYIISLNERISNWKYGHLFHDVESPAAHCTGVLSAIIRAQDRMAFVTDLLESNAIRQTIPELYQTLSETDRLVLVPLLRAQRRSELGISLLRLMASKEQESFATRLLPLIQRKWSEEDQALASYVESGQYREVREDLATLDQKTNLREQPF